MERNVSTGSTGPLYHHTAPGAMTPPLTAVRQSPITRALSMMMPIIVGTLVIAVGVVIDSSSTDAPVEDPGGSDAVAAVATAPDEQPTTSGRHAVQRGDDPTPSTCVTASCAEARLVALVNDARRTRGIPPLRARDDLSAVAAEWSAVMASTSTMFHNEGRFDQACCWLGLVENVAVHWSDGDLDEAVAEVHAALMRSPGHRANILWESADHIGVGVEVSATGQLWVTQLFRRFDRTGDCSIVVGCSP